MDYICANIGDDPPNCFGFKLYHLNDPIFGHGHYKSLPIFKVKVMIKVKCHPLVANGPVHPVLKFGVSSFSR